MKPLRLATALLCLALAQPHLTEAQPPNHSPQHGRCAVIDQGLLDRLKRHPSPEDELRSSSIRHRDLNNGDFIPKTWRTYVFRLALGISKAGLESEFEGKPERIAPWLADLEQRLNAIYERDCGIRFEMVRDPRLLLTTDKHPHSPSVSPTQLIDEAIGADAYDIGLVIAPPLNGVHRAAVLAGAMNKTTKAAGFANSDLRYIARGLGHLLGARDTHAGVDDKTNLSTRNLRIEPGEGRSIMSDSRETPTFFALWSVLSMRDVCSRLNQYGDLERTRLIVSNEDYPDTNSVVALPFEGVGAELSRGDIKLLYKVTRGTYFQFQPRAVKPHPDFKYNAESNDDADIDEVHNAMQCFYESVRTPYIMFHPRYDRPSGGTPVAAPVEIPYSANYRTGIYTYALSVSNRGQHDSYLTKLQIVEGEPFRITRIDGGISPTTHTATAGAPLSIQWQPCHELYTAQSRVRILLSSDFGETFDHVLADNVPNTGSWQGAWPYATIGRISYRGRTSALHDKPIENVRGGVIKVEVIGEAAYSLSHIVPYAIRNGEIAGTGGFLLETNPSRSLIFTSKDGSTPPVQYLEVPNPEAIPRAVDLKARLAGGQAVIVSPSELTDGAVVTRTWQATIGGISSTYTQTIRVIEGSVPIDPLKLEAKERQALATELYQHIGTLGYPRANLSLSRSYRQLYPQVYTESGELRHDVTTQNITELHEMLRQFETIDIPDIVMPTDGLKYRVISYHQSYRGDLKFYISKRPQSDSESTGAGFTLTPSDAIAYTYHQIDGIHRFVAPDGQVLKLEKPDKSLGDPDTRHRGYRLVRGFTWGSFALVTADNRSIVWAQAEPHRAATSHNPLYRYTPQQCITNDPKRMRSSDFQFDPVAEGYDITLEAPAWSGVTARLVGQGATSLVVVAQGAGRYRIAIPETHALGRVRFASSGGQTLEVQLTGRAETFTALGRSHRITIPESCYATLYLPYAVALPRGVKAFVAKQSPSRDDTTGKVYQLTIEPLSRGIPAMTPVILVAERAGEYDFVETSESLPTPPDNDLTGTTREIAASERDMDNYLYFDLAHPTGTPSSSYSLLRYPRLGDKAKIEANTAYILVNKASTRNADAIERVVLKAREFEKAPTETPNPNEAGNTRSIEDIGSDSDTRSVRPDEWTGAIYDPAGRLVGWGNYKVLPSGIYILGREKVFKP